MNFLKLMFVTLFICGGGCSNADLLNTEIEIFVQLEYDKSTEKLKLSFTNTSKYTMNLHRYDSGYNGEIYNPILKVYCNNEKLEYVGPISDFDYEKDNVKIDKSASISYSFIWKEVLYKIKPCENNRIMIQYDFYNYNKNIGKTFHLKSQLFEMPYREH